MRLSGITRRWKRQQNLGAHYRGLDVYLNVRKRAHKHVFVSVWDVQYWLSGVPLASGCSASNVQGREAFDTT